jgi:EPS-associated MarR family transcriptional regulator
MKHTKDLFEVLRRLNSRPKYSQRDLAKDLGFSLGKLNYCLKSLNEKGLVKIKNFVQNKHKTHYIKKYVLTAKGIKFRIHLTMEFMKKKMAEYEELKNEIKK